MLQRGLILRTVLVVVAFFFFPATVESQTVVTVYPPNVAAQRGDQNVVIGCNVTGLPLGNYNIEWKYYPTWQTNEFLIYSTANSINNDPTNFTVYPMTTAGNTNFLDLSINTLKAELATEYRCDIYPPTPNQGKSVQVAALDPVECLGSMLEFDEFNQANISCSVNYFETHPTVDPMIMWYRNGEQVPEVIVGNDSPTRKTARMTKNVTADDDDQEFYCIVSSDPDYSDNCSTLFYVRHSVSMITFYPPSSADALTEVAVGASINCTANGRPAPTVEWYDDTWNLLSASSEMIVTQAMQDQPQPITLFCRANNSIDNGVTVASYESNYTFTVVPAPVVQSSGVEAWVIAVAVIVPIVVIAAIAIAVFFGLRHRKKKKAKAKTTNGSAAARPTTTTTTTTYSPVPGTDYTSVSRPPPTTAPRTTGSITSGPPGPDNRNGAAPYGQNPGYGDLGVQTYGGSNQAVNAYPPTRGSVTGSNQALGVPGVSMNPNPVYPVRSSNQALNTTNPRPNYPYTGSNSALNTSLSVGPNAAPGAPGGSYGRQPSIASSSGRSHASSYNAPIPAMGMNRYPNDLSSMHGSEV